MSSVVDYFFTPLAPVLALVVSGLILVVLECLPTKVAYSVKVLVGLLGPILSAIAVMCLSKGWPMIFASVGYSGTETWLKEFCRMYQLDHLGLSLYWALSVFAFLGVIFVSSMKRDEDIQGEILALIQFVVVGMMLLVTARNLLMIFVALELLSLPTYVLVAIRKEDRKSLEAGLKYFLFGSFGTILLLLGTVFLYAQFGTTDLTGISDLLANQTAAAPSVLVLGAMATILVAVAFKVGLVPFHMWLPDVYEGAPTAVTGLMGSAIKLAAFGLALRFFAGVFLPLRETWSELLDWMAVISMFVGNIAALIQPSLKRMFAYSSIAHAGYLMLGVGAVAKLGPDHSSTVVFYLVVYGLMFLGVFAVIALLESQNRNDRFESLSGFGFTHALIGGCVAFFALSAAGIPPTPGFFAKYFIFLDAVSAGKTVFVVLALISSAIGLFYYLKVLVHLYMKEAPEGVARFISVDRTVVLGILACALAMVMFALFPMGLGVS